MPTVFAGHPDENGFQDGSLLAARFVQPRGLAYLPDFNTLYVCDFGNNCIRSIDLSTEVVDTVAGPWRAFFLLFFRFSVHAGCCHLPSF